MTAEKSVLGCQLLDARMIDVVRDIISPADFYADIHATIQKALNKLRESGADIDAFTVSQQLESTGDLEDIGSVAYILELLETVPIAAHAATYAKAVKDCSVRRKQISIATKLMESAYDVTADRDEVVSLAVRSTEALAETQAAGSLTLMADEVTAFIGSLERGVAPTLSVMIPEIDMATGGACPGEMIVIGARPSHGKSLFALQSLDEAASHGLPCLIISEEMSSLSLAGRMVSSITTIPSEEWMKETDRLKFDAREHFTGRANIVIAQKCQTASGAEKAIATAVRKYGVKIVAIDYAQLLKGDGDAQHERIGDVSRRMKAMATKHDLIVLLLAQLNRKIEERESSTPGLADLAGSGSLEQDADIVLFPLWPWKLDPTYGDPMEYRVYQAKNRNRGVGTAVIGMRIDPSRQRLKGTTPEW
jgi:replicative DNA helicase